MARGARAVYHSPVVSRTPRVSLPRRAWIRAELGGAAQLPPEAPRPQWAGGHCFVCALLTTTWRPQGWHSQRGWRRTPPPSRRTEGHSRSQDTGICHHGALSQPSHEACTCPRQALCSSTSQKGLRWEGAGRRGARGQTPAQVSSCAGPAVQKPWAQAEASQAPAPRAPGQQRQPWPRLSLRRAHLGSRGPWLPSLGAQSGGTQPSTGPRARLTEAHGLHFPRGLCWGRPRQSKSRPTCAHLRPPSPTLPGQRGQVGTEGTGGDRRNRGDRHNHAQSLPGSSQHGLHMFRTRPAGTGCRQKRALRGRSRRQAHTAQEGTRPAGLSAHWSPAAGLEPQPLAGNGGALAAPRPTRPIHKTLGPCSSGPWGEGLPLGS